MLDAEVDAITPSGKMVTVMQFNEAAAEDWAVGGEMRAASRGGPNHFIVDVIVLHGLLEGERRQATHRRIRGALQRAFADVPNADPMLALLGAGARGLVGLRPARRSWRSTSRRSSTPPSTPNGATRSGERSAVTRP